MQLFVHRAGRVARLKLLVYEALSYAACSCSCIARAA
jgi:hypothetical protein